MDTSEHGLSHYFEGAGATVNGLIGIKMRWSSVSSFSIRDEQTKIFKYENLKHSVRANFRCYTKYKRLFTYTDVNIVLCFCVGNSLLNFVQVFYIYLA
jgi:hypothetical protein